MDQRWEFLAPWWKALKPCISFSLPKNDTADEYVWQVPDLVLKVAMPTRRGSRQDEASFRKQFQMVQEALLLLAAVEHADYLVYDDILTYGCGIKRGRPGEELDAAWIAAKFLLDVDVNGYENQTDGGAIAYDLVRLCGTHQREHPSEEYLAALSQIAALDKNLEPGGPAVDIKIPVKLQFLSHTRVISDLASRDDAKKLSDIAKAEKEIETQWAAYVEAEEEKALEPGTLRCTFVLEPMTADFSGLVPGAGMPSRIADALQHLVENNVWLTFLNIPVGIRRSVPGHELEARRSLGLLLRRLLNSKDQGHIRYRLGHALTDQNAQVTGNWPVQFLKLRCEATMPARDFEAMCSALVLTRTTTKLALELEINPSDETNREHWWKWLAYGLFSRRARACSTLETLTISGVGRLTTADVRAFTSVLTSEHPEETLCGTSRGVVEERDAKLGCGARIRWNFDEGVQSNFLTLDTPIEFVRTFSDDGTSDWVNILIAGFARCQVRRCDLEFHGEPPATRGSGGITSLTLGFPKSDNVATLALSSLIRAIGSSLRTLVLDGPKKVYSREFDENDIIQSCPNLLELTLARDIIEIQLDFREYRALNTPIPGLTVPWFDVLKLADYLADTGNPLTKCARRLKVSLLQCFVPVADLESGNGPHFPHYVNAVVKMLEENQRLQYVSVKSPYYRFVSDATNFHFKPISRQRKPLPRECMLAFLSVLESRASTEFPKDKKQKTEKSEVTAAEFDSRLVAKIFSFAALPVLREVYYESPQLLVYADEQGRELLLGPHGQISERLQYQQDQRA